MAARVGLIDIREAVEAAQNVAERSAGVGLILVRTYHKVTRAMSGAQEALDGRMGLIVGAGR